MLNPPRVEWRYPKLIAHRGAGKDAPENTFAAFKVGAANGYTMFECDVKLSQDKVLFLLHDSTLDRTTNAQGLAKDRTWAELATLDAGHWHSPQYQGEKLMSFADLVDYILENRFRLDIEAKPNEGEAYETGAAIARYLKARMQKKIDQYIEIFFKEAPEQFFAKLHEELFQLPEPYCLKNQFLISSFSPEALRGAKESVAKIPRALLIDDWSQGEDAVWETLEQLECRGVITNYQIITPEFLEKCHKAGRFVMVYTANKMPEILALLDQGIDSVITDNMDAVKQYKRIKVDE